MDWESVLAIAALVVGSFGYLSRQMNRMEDRLTARIDGVEANLGPRIDQLTERYIAHLERHSH